MVDMGASRDCASMLGPVRWVSASTWERARNEREQEGGVSGGFAAVRNAGPLKAAVLQCATSLSV